MRQLLSLVLAAAALLAAGAWPQAAALPGAEVRPETWSKELLPTGQGPVSQSLLLAQSAEQPKAKSEEKPKAKPALKPRPPTEARPKASMKMEKRAPAELQMEKAAPASEAPARAGTGKIGGTIIRSREGPEGE
jgi:hypothetical protein